MVQRVTRNRRNQGMKWIRNTTRAAIYLRDAHCCVYCGAKGWSVGVGLVLDHVVPTTKGGTNAPTNLVTCCKSCNDSKGRRDVESWIARRFDERMCAGILARVAAATSTSLDRAAGRRAVATRRRFKS